LNKNNNFRRTFLYDEEVSSHTMGTAHTTTEATSKIQEQITHQISFLSGVFISTIVTKYTSLSMFIAAYSIIILAFGIFYDKNTPNRHAKYGIPQFSEVSNITFIVLMTPIFTVLLLIYIDTKTMVDTSKILTQWNVTLLELAFTCSMISFLQIQIVEIKSFINNLTEWIERNIKSLESLNSDKYRILEGAIESFNRNVRNVFKNIKETAESLRESLDDIRGEKDNGISDNE